MNLNPHKEGQYWRVRFIDWDGVRKSYGLGNVDKVSRSEAIRKARQIAIDIARGEREAHGDITLSRWVEQYIDSKASLTVHSHKLMRLTCDLLVEIIGDKNIKAVTSADAVGFAKAVAERTVGKDTPRPVSANTVRRHVRYARAVFQAAIQAVPPMLTANPFRSVPSSVLSTDKDWATVTDADMVRIMDECPDDGFRCLFALARWGGLRRSEAIALRWEDIDLGGKRITVLPRSKYDTTKQRYRELPIEPRLAAFLATIKPTGTGPCHGVARLNLTRTVCRILKRAGLTYAKPLHTLRKNLQTEWMSRYPAPKVCYWLGNSVAVAMKHYDRPTPEDFASVAESCPKQTPNDQKVQ